MSFGPSAMAAPTRSAVERTKTIAESARRARKRIQNPPYCVPVGSDIVVWPPSADYAGCANRIKALFTPEAPSPSGNLLQHLAKRLIQPIDLRLLDDERRGQRDDVRRHTDQHPGLEGLHEGLVGAPAGRPGTGLE